MKLDLLIRGGTLLTMSPGMEIIPDPLIGISNGKIIFTKQPGAPLAAEEIDAEGCIILPGLINTHTHLAMTAFRGLADDLPLGQWLTEKIFPAEARFVNRETVYHASRLGMAEMILSGTTTFCDAYFYEGAVARAAMETGLRGFPAQGFIDLPAPVDPGEHLRVAEKFIRRWEGSSPLVRPALVCHSAYTCEPATLRTLKQFSRGTGIPFVVHVAETAEEVETIRRRFGTTPIRFLHELGVLDPMTIAVHAVWVDDEEIAILRDTGAKVSHNPESNMKLASGIAPAPLMLERGINVGLGTDGPASNNDLDMFLEMGAAARLHKVASLDPTVMDAQTVLKMATIDGARVLGIQDLAGSVEPGKSADLVIVKTDQPHLTPLYNPYSHLVYSACGADVSTVIVEGKVLMRDRRLLTMELARDIEYVKGIAKKFPVSSLKD